MYGRGVKLNFLTDHFFVEGFKNHTETWLKQHHS